MVVLGFPGSSVKEFICNAGDPSSIPGSGKYPGERLGYPFQYSWASLVAQMIKNLPAMWELRFNPWVAKIFWRRAWHPTPVFLPGEFQWIEEPCRLQSMGLQRMEVSQKSKHKTTVLSCAVFSHLVLC